MVDKLKILYQPAEVTYIKMSPQPVSTVSAPCLFVSRVYKSPRMVAALNAVRKTFYANLDVIKETANNHPSWSLVDPDFHGPWPWMNLGDAAPEPTAATPGRPR